MNPFSEEFATSDTWAELVYRIGVDNLPLLDRALRELQQEQRRRIANEILSYRDNPEVKPHLLEGEWTGMGMAANHIYGYSAQE